MPSSSKTSVEASDVTLDRIHDPDFEAEVHRLVALDVARLQERREEFVERACPACHSDRLHPAFTFQGFDYKRCGDCGLLFISPGPTNEHTLWFLEVSEGLRLWRESMPQAVRQRRKPMYVERAQYLADLIEKYGVTPDSLLEIGAGNGELAEALLEIMPNLSRVFLYEPQPLSFQHPKVEICESLEGLDAHGGGVDLVACFEVIEHIPDPDDLLDSVHTALSSDGLFVLSTPNERGFEMQVLKTLSTSLPFDHVCLYSPEALTRLLQRKGFEVVEITTPGKLDLEMVVREYQAGRLDLSDNPAVQFLAEARDDIQSAFQSFLAQSGQSSHMRVVARKRGS